MGGGTAMKPAQGRRSWVKLWINDWLEGTTRYQMTDAQRAFWIDLIAMAGRSRFGGIVCSGKDGGELIGYPLSKFQGLLAEPFDVEATLALFEQTGKIKVQISGGRERKLYVLFILNWVHYQSEYERKRGVRERRAKNVPSDVPQKSTGGSQPVSMKSTSTEGEGDKEVVVEESVQVCPQDNDFIPLSGGGKGLGFTEYPSVTPNS
jgi:hypothetical protein